MHAAESSTSPSSAVICSSKRCTLAFQRTPTEAERASARDFLARQQKLAGGEEQAWADLCQTLFSTNEFLYVN